MRRQVGSFFLLLTVALMGSAALPARGQEEPAVLPPARITLAQPGVQVEIEEGADFVVPHVQIVGNAGEGHFLFATPMMADNDAGLIQVEQIQKELELLDGQKQQIRKLNEQMHQETRQIFDEMQKSFSERTGSPSRGEGGASGSGGGARAEGTARGERRAFPHEEMSKRMRTVQEDTQKRIQEVLLPHQQKRLSQIALRMKIKNRGTVGTLGDSKLAKELEINDEQKDRLRKKAEQVQADLEKKIAKLREEAREEILGELSSTQRQKLKDLLGDEFELQSPRPSIAPRVKSRVVRPAESSEKQ